MNKCEQRYKAYRGVLEKQKEEAQWTAKYHPPYILQMIEAMIAAILDPNPKVRVRPRPHLGDDPVQRQKGAKTLENLIDYSLEVDDFAQKQRDWVWQALVTGMTVAKIDWITDHTPRKSLQYKPTRVHDQGGNYLATVDSLQEVTHEGPRYDGPCVSIWDVRDFYWPESAVSLSAAPYVICRSWMTPGDAKQLAASHDVAVNDLAPEVFKPESTERESLWGKDRTKGLVAVDEMWTDDYVCAVINGQVKFRDEPNPFWHGKKPFVVTSAMPEPFQFNGVSVVELVSELQSMLWNLQNQRIDSLRLMANMIMLIRADVDINDFEWAPGALWNVETTTDAVKPLEINPAVANMTLDAEALIKGDLQNIPGGALFSGADSQTIDQNTATGVSIVSSIAQKIVQARQQNFRYGQREIVEQVGQNLQQYTRDPFVQQISGPGAVWEPHTPDEIQGQNDYVLDVSDESVVRQERQAEWQAKLQTLAQVAQIAMLSGTKIDWTTLLQDALEQGFGVQDGERYIQQAQPPQAQGAPPGLQQPPGPPGQGVTAPQSISPQAPSNGASLNPAVMMQQALAGTGGQGGFNTNGAG